MATFLVIRQVAEPEDPAIAPYEERLKKYCKARKVIDNVWVVDTQGDEKPPIVHHLGECHIKVLPFDRSAMYDQ